MAIISVSLPSDGTTADAADYNTPITTIVNAINGNLDSTNISSLSGAKITTGTIPGTALDATTAGGYITGLAAPNTVTALGNRSYSMVFNSVNYTSTLSAGMRLRTTRIVAAPTQCTSLNGTTQYYSRASASLTGITFTNNYSGSAWVKLTSYALAGIISRFNGTSGWRLTVTASGQVEVDAFNGGGANNHFIQSYQSIPLNKWVHIAFQQDMSNTTNDATNNYIMIDGVNVPCLVGRQGTNPTTLIQAGNLEVGSANAALFFPGKIAQVAIYNAKVTQATILASMHQTLAGTETSLISAYSFNNTINDLNANANNLTANGSAVATNADSPFGGQADGTISSTLDYAIITKTVFSTNTTLTVQVPEGCTIPTSGGVSAVSYSSQKAPYGMPVQKDKYRVTYVYKQQTATVSNVNYAAYAGVSFTPPVGAWEVGLQMGIYATDTTTYQWNLSDVSQTGLAATAADNSMQFRVNCPAGGGTLATYFSLRKNVLLSSATTYQLYQSGASVAGGILGTTALCELYAECTLL